MHRITWSLVLAGAIAVGHASPASAQVSDQEWSDAYAYLARVAGHYNPDVQLRQRKQTVLSSFRANEGRPFSETTPQDELVVRGWAQKNRTVSWIADFGTTSVYRQAAHEIADALGLGKSDVEAELADFQLAFEIKPFELFGGFGALVYDSALFAEDEPTMTFALMHELGHNLWSIPAFSSAVTKLIGTPTSNDYHLLEYGADVIAARWMSKKYGKEQIVRAAGYVLQLEGASDPNHEAHPPTSDRLGMIEKVLQQ